MSDQLNLTIGESIPELDGEVIGGKPLSIDVDYDNLPLYPNNGSGHPEGVEPVPFAEPASDLGIGTSSIEEAQSDWDWRGWAASNSIIQTFGPLLREVFAEPIANFSIGAAKGTAELGIGAYELATGIADLTPDMEPAAREDFIKKVMDEVKTWQAYDGDDGEAQFMDKVFYHLGHAAPGMLATIGATMAAGAAVPAIASAVGLGSLAKYGWTIGNAFKFTLGATGRFVTTFGAGSGVSIVQEYANALADGREAQPLDAFIADAGFNAAFSTIFHFTKHLPVNNFWKIMTAAAIGGGITKAGGASNEEAAANAILFALMQGGQIRMSVDKDAPGAVTQAYRNIMNWVNGRIARKQPYGVRDYFQEFKPITFSKEFYPDGFTIAMNEVAINPTNELSTWDGWIRGMEQNYELGNMEGVQPHHLPELIFNEWKDRGAVVEKDRPTVQSIIKAEVEARAEVNKQWMEQYGKDHGRHYNPKYLKEDPRYLDGIPERDWDLAPKEKIDITEERTLREKVAVRTYIGKDGTTKTKELKLWHLSQAEAIRIFGNEPGDMGGWGGADIDAIKMMHKRAVQERLEFVANADSYKTRVPPIALKEYKDDLGVRYRHLYAKKDTSLSKLYGDEDGIDKFLRQNMALDEFRKMAYDKWKEGLRASQARLEKLRQAQSTSICSMVKRASSGVYEGIVGSAGLLDYKWRGKGYDDLADAFHMSYGASSKTDYDWHLLDKETNISNWEPDYLDDVSGLYRALAFRAHKFRLQGTKGKDFKTQLTMAELRGLAEEIQLRAMSDETPWSLEQILHDVNAIKNQFDTSLDYAVENGMVPERAYAEIRGKTWMPIRRMIDLEQRILHIGNEADVHNSKQILKYLQEAEESDTQFDIRHLLHGQLTRVNNAVAKTRILQSAAEVARRFPDQTEIVVDPSKIPNWKENKTHVMYAYLENGKEHRLYLDAEQSRLLNAGVFMELANRNDGKEIAKRAFRVLSGAGVRQQLVSADPSFAFSMVVPDMMHIIMTHPEFHTNSFKSGWFDLYKLSAEYQAGNWWKKSKDHVVKPFFYNFGSVVRRGKDSEYKKFMDDGGTALSLARAEMDQGLLDSMNERLRLGEPKGKLKAGAKIAYKMYSKWVEMAAALEMAGRLTEYQMLQARGLSGNRSAAKTTERLNYGRAGLWVETPRKYLPFLNAGIQSTDSVVKMALKNPKAVAKMIPQLMIGYGLLRAWNEMQGVPGSDMDRPLEERVRSTLIAIPGATEVNMADPGGRDIQYGFILKDSLHPVAATSKLLSILVGDYWYQKNHPDEFQDGPELIPQDEVEAVYSIIAASAPVELKGFLPPLAHVWEIYNNNTLMLGDRKIYKNEGAVSRADEINYMYDGATRNTSNLAVSTARQMQDILPNHWSASSPARLEAATTQWTPSNTIVDTIKYPMKILADGGVYEGEENYWRKINEIMPGINRHVGRTYPSYSAKERNFVRNDTQLYNYEKKVMAPIRPKMQEIFDIYKKGVLADTNYLPDTEEAINSLAKTFANDGEWPTAYGEQNKAAAVEVLKRFIQTMVNHYKLDHFIRQADKLYNVNDTDAPFENATDAIGSINEWRNQFGPKRLPEDKAQFLFHKWKWVTMALEDAPKSYRKMVIDRFDNQAALISSKKHVNDGTMFIYKNLIKDYKKGLP